MTVVSLYVSVNWVKSTCSGHIYHNFSCCDDLSKFGKEYLNSLKCEFCTFFLHKIAKIFTYCLSRTNRHKVIKSENSPFFWPTLYSCIFMPSVLWQCWLGIRKSICPVKIEWWGVGVVICLERGADCLYMVQHMPVSPKPHHLLPRLNPDWFYLSGTGLPRLSWTSTMAHLSKRRCGARQGDAISNQVVYQVVGYYVTRECASYGILWCRRTPLCRRRTNRSVSGQVQL